MSMIMFFGILGTLMFSIVLQHIIGTHFNRRIDFLEKQLQYLWEKK